MLPNQFGLSNKFRFPWRNGNRFKLYVDGNSYFSQILDAIGTAYDYICIEMYLIESGVVLDRFINALVAAADRNVSVYLLLDDFGARDLSEADRKRLTYHNIHIIYYNPLKSHSNLYNLYRVLWKNIDRDLYRDHRKIFIIDGIVAYTGGTGITDHFDPPLHPEKRWRETVIEIRGPVIADWLTLFCDVWNKYSEMTLSAPHYDESPTGSALGRVSVNEHTKWHGIRNSLLRHLQNAETRIWFTTAYFVPSWRIRRALRKAAKRGVDVRLALPGPISDHPAVRHAGRRYYSRLLRSGVRIFEYQPRFLHTKMVMCDNWVTIGSSNFDHWNLHWNLEANQEILCTDFAADAEMVYLEDFNQSLEIRYHDWCQRSRYLQMLEWFWTKVDRFLIKLSHRGKS